MFRTSRVPSPRALFALLFVWCAGLIGYALWLQHADGQEPCPLCILQRYAFMAVGLVSLVGAAVASRHAPVVTRVVAALVLVAALAGAGIAARQSWLQHHPPLLAECGPGLDFILDANPLTQALPMIFRGSGDCAEVKWRFLGLSIAEWALLHFVAMAGVAAVAWGRRTRG
jgi:disulfide bond formation protein DsbB